jgi:hypothetical protein
MIFKNLQIIDSNENEITEDELEEINNDLKKLYINLIENFNKDTINAQESVLKDIIAALTEKGSSLKDKYDSYIKKGGDVKDEEGEEGKEGNGKVKGKGDKGDGSKDGEDEGEGSEEVKKLERLKKEAAEANKEVERLNKEADAAKLKEGANEEEQLEFAKEVLVAATAAHGAALKARDAKKSADDATKAAAKAAEDAKKKAEEAAEDAKKKAEEAKKKEDEDDAAEAKKKEDEAKKKAEDDAAEAKKKEDPLVFNFEYNESSCYVNSVLQMLIDNDELCDKIIVAANDKKLKERFNKDALTEEEEKSNDYLLYLLNNIILYHRESRHSIGELKKPSYNEYILPLRKYLNVVDQVQFRIANDADPSDLFEIILNK